MNGTACPILQMKVFGRTTIASLHPSAMVLKEPMVWQERKGEKSKPVERFDLPMRARIDAEITDRAVAFIEREAKTEDPFFLFLPYTQTHQPRIPHADFDGKSGNGVRGDLLMQMDAYTGQVLDALKTQGIADNTIVIFTSDNGGDFFEDASFPGPWRGTYFTGLKGSLRVPFIMRWPGHIPAGSVNKEIVHEMDLLPTLAAIAGGTIPDDRIVDGVKQVNFITGATAISPRESVIVYLGPDLFAVKWHGWKVAFKEMDEGYGSPVKEFPAPVINDPRKERPVSTVIQSNTWVGGPVMRALNAHLQSLVDEPSIPTGTTDPYVPAN
ncbi:MAG: arylsulfatase A-like enzyme [Paracoccaceae bacterium]|jgi:arylsulfatase A-like enzyme